MDSSLEIRREGSIVRVALNRPQVRNAFNAEMIAELTDTFTGLNRERDVRAVILSGNGASFSAGADVSWMRASLDFSEEENMADAQRMSDMFYAIDSLRSPVVAQVHGAALGGGMGLMAVADIVVAEETTVFGFTETRLGIIPAVISRFVLPKIGESWARALFLTGERFDADLARRIGLVHWIAPDGRSKDIVDEKIGHLLKCGPLAVQEAKALVAGAVERDRGQLRDYTAERIAALRTGPEGQEGLRAFLEKRPATWMEGE
jgi:methylglutaconyl-CoA hydratase